MVSKYREKTLINVAIPLARDNLPDKFNRNISGKEAVREGKGLTLFISNESMNDIIKIIKSLEDSGALIDRITETEKHEIKKQKGEFPGALLAHLVASFAQPVIFSVVKGISGRRVRRAGRGYIVENF